MAAIYAMSDIHGQLEVFEEMLSLVDLSKSENKLVLCGDYIDHDQKRTESFRRIMELQREFPEQIICLMGNHEDYFLADCGVQPFCSAERLEEEGDSLFPLSSLLQAEEKRAPLDFDDAEVLRWLSQLPPHYETERQIFVHAGIDEEAEDLWAVGTANSMFREKFPPTTGPFYKDIIAGHVGVHCPDLANDPEFHEVFWDGESHYYLDGTTEFSGKLPLLKYDTETGRYTTFEQTAEGKWVETPVIEQS